MPYQIYIGGLFSVAALVLLGLRLWAEHRGEQDRVYLYRPLTMVSIAMVAMVAPEPISVFYKGAIILALLLALGGEAIMMISGTPIMVGVIHVSLVSFLYFLAFASQVSMAWPTVWALLIPLYTAVVFYLLASHLGEFWFPGLAFALLLALMTWMALETVAQHGVLWAWLALAGSLSLDVAATILGWRTYRRGFRFDGVLLAVAYVIGQWLVAASVWGPL